MWAGELFKAFREDDSRKERELTKSLPLTTKNSLQSIKSVYKKHEKQGMTPFIAAILHDNVALCEQLIEEGIDLGQEGSAVIVDEGRFIQFNNDAGKLIAFDTNSNTFKDFNKTTPMFWAIKCDKLCLVDKLIQGGHKMNGLVEKLAGMPTLSFAILSRNIPVVQHLLLNHTCDLHEKSLPDMKPLDVAIRSGNIDMVRLILEHGETADCANHQLSPLSQAVFLNNMSMVTLILSMGANINFGVETGNVFPPLNMAILRGHFAIASFLINEGADVTAKDSTDNTALHLLLSHMNIQNKNMFYQLAFRLAQLLVNKGAKVDIANKTGEIPLVKAVMQCDSDLVDIFLSTPVDLNTLILNSKATLLHIAVSPPIKFGAMSLPVVNAKDFWNRRCNIVKSLLKKGVDVNAQSENGRTSLHFAAESGNVSVIKLLLASKVDVNKQSANGKVALHCAAYNGSFEVVKLLLESGAEVNVKDNVNSTPLDFGVMENECFSSDTTKLLIDYGADLYNHGIFKGFKIYDVVVAMMNTDVIKLFWREGYPYDFTVFLPSKNLRVSMQAFFQNLGVENIITCDFKKRLNTINFKQMEELINTQKEFVNAVEENKVKRVLNALQKGAEVASGSVKIPSPLHFVAEKGFTDIAQVLLSKNVQPNMVDGEGKTPAQLAVEFGHFKMYKTLLQNGACYSRTGSDTKLFQRQGNGEHHKLYLLIKKAFKDVKRGDHCILENLKKYVTLKEWDVYLALVNCVDEKGRTLMVCAVEKGDSVIVQKLMEYRLQAPITTSDLQSN